MKLKIIVIVIIIVIIIVIVILIIIVIVIKIVASHRFLCWAFRRRRPGRWSPSSGAELRSHLANVGTSTQTCLASYAAS